MYSPQPSDRNGYESLGARAGATEQLVQRRGLIGFWLNLTAPPWPETALPVSERERLRKAELTSVNILAVAGVLLALLSNSLADPATAESIIAMAVVLLIALLLNRTGGERPWRTTVAAYLVPAFMMVAVMSAILQGGGLRLSWLPAYDLLALPIIIVGLSGHRLAPWFFGVIAIAFVVATYLLMPHAPITAAGAQNFDDIAYETGIFGVWGMINRHVALLFFASLLGWIGARSVEGAIHRADRAEEIAALEHQIAAQKQQLEYGMQQILQTHVRAANGDLSARAPLAQDNMLWQIAQSLNNLLTRLQRSGGADFTLQRTEEELRRLAAAIDDANAGRQPIWPSLSGTPADIIIERITRAGGRRQVSGTSQMPHGAQLPSFPSAHDAGHAPWSQALPQQPMHQEPQPPWGQPPVDPWQQSQQDPGANPWNLLPGGN